MNPKADEGGVLLVVQHSAGLRSPLPLAGTGFQSLRSHLVPKITCFLYREDRAVLIFFISHKVIWELVQTGLQSFQYPACFFLLQDLYVFLFFFNCAGLGAAKYCSRTSTAEKKRHIKTNKQQNEMKKTSDNDSTHQQLHKDKEKKIYRGNPQEGCNLNIVCTLWKHNHLWMV